MDDNGNGEIEPIELGVQGWFNGRLTSLDFYWFDMNWTSSQTG